MIHKNELSRAELAKKTGLTRPAITNIVDDLIRKEIVIEAGVKSSSGGRKPVILQINNDKIYCIGVSIRYDLCMVGIASLDGQVIAEETLDFSALSAPEDGIREIAVTLKKLLSEYVTDQKILGVGVSSPGPVDIFSGTILNPPSIELWRNVPIVDELQKYIDLKIYLEKDAVSSALIEKNYGYGRQYKNFMHIDVVSHGVGCGIVIGDSLYRGVEGLGGEFGHITINVMGKQCHCGNIGCIECYASIDNVLDSLKDDYPEINSWEEIVVRSKNDERLVQVIKDEAHYLGAGIVSVVNLLELEAVVLSGEIVFDSYFLIDELRKYVNGRSINRDKKTVDIFISDKDHNKSFLSSATVVSEKFFSGELMDF